MQKIKLKWQGFTLIEVMVALVVVAVALSSLSQVSANFLFNQMSLEQRVYANWLAESEIIRLHSGVQEGLRAQAKEDFMGHAWRLTSKTEPTLIPGIMKVTVSVYVQGEDKIPMAKLDTIWSKKGDTKVNSQ